MDTAVNGISLKQHQGFRHVGDVSVYLRFGKKLRQVREQKKISQEKLAAMAGLHRTYVSSVERGERNISLLNIEKLSLALGISMAALMPGPEKSQ